MSNQSWYQRHGVGRAAPQAPAAPRAVPQYGVDAFGRTVLLNPPEPQPDAQAYAQQVPPGATDITTAVRLWKGTAAAQNGAGYCPRCGSGNYFPNISSADARGSTRLHNMEAGTTSSHCFECGFREGGAPGPTPQPMDSLRGIKDPSIAEGGIARSWEPTEGISHTANGHIPVIGRI